MNLGGTVHLNRMGVCVVFLCFIIVALYLIRDVEDTDMKKIPTVNIRRLLLASIEIAEKGGLEVVKVRKTADLNIKSKGKTKEGADNPVTQADYNSHCVMYFGLQKLYPSLKIVSEEQISEERCGELSSPALTLQTAPGLGLDSLMDEELPYQDLTVWIDPLDATQEFTENLLQYVTTLVCVAYKGRPIVGVIHRPFGSEAKTSWAWVRRGLSPDLISYKSVKSDPSVIVSRSHTGAIVEIIHRAFGPDTKVNKAGGAGYKVMQVVSGNASAYVHSTAIKKWDICAGDALLSAMGGTMSTLVQEEIDYSPSAGPVNSNGLLATMDKHTQYAAKLHAAMEKDMHL